MTKFAFLEVWDDDAHKGISRKVVTLEQGKRIQQVLDCEIEPENEAQAAYVLRIKAVYLPPSARSGHADPDDYQKQYWTGLDAQRPENASGTATDHLTHAGRLQGMGQAIPTGDQ